MKVFALIFFVLSFKIQAACLPESFDSSLEINSSLLTPVMEEHAVSFEERMEKTLARDWDIVIKLNPLNPRVNAEITKEGRAAIIEVWGGMIHHPRMNERVFVLLLCHEVGHLLGGPPLKSRLGWSSTEGQADYFSTRQCARAAGLSEAHFYESAERLVQIYADVTGEPYPELRRCDDTIVDRINFGYPSAQCRLDTLVAGWTNAKRPFCWFKE